MTGRIQRVAFIHLDDDGFTAYLDAYKEQCILYITIPSTDQAVCTYLSSQIIP